LSIVDKDRYQLVRIICWREKAKEYCEKAKTHGLLVKQFDYNPEKFNEELKELTKIEHALQLSNTKLTGKSRHAFSELYIALVHMKVMRAFIDGVLRFGIPITFAIAIVKPNPGQDKAILEALNREFIDKQFSDMFSTGGKDEKDVAGDEEYFSFANVPLSTPVGLK